MLSYQALFTNYRFRRLLLVGLMFGIAVLVLIGFVSRFHSFYFQDETDHVTVGWMMWRFDRQLYRDLSTNHMPVPVFLGAFFSHAIAFNSLYTLVSGLREWMWALWTGLALVATWRFRGAGAITYTFLLLLNFYYFGFHVLTDPVGAMCVATIMLYFVFSLWRKQVFGLFDGLWFGLVSALAGFSLLAIWPFILLTFAITWWQQNVKFRLASLIGVFLVIVGVFSLVNPVDWWRETVANNYLYVLKDQASFTLSEKLGIVALPLTVLTQPTSQQSVLIFGLFVLNLWLWYQWWRLSTWSRAKKTAISFITLLALISLNTRVPHSRYVFYRGIHLLPYLAGLSSLLAASFYIVKTKLSQAQNLAVIVFLLFLLTLAGRFMYEKIDYMTEYYVQYNEFDSTGVALGRLKNSGETLMTGPDGYGYINQMADLPIFGKQNFHLSWSFYVPYLHDYFFQLFNQKPPTYVFVKPGGDPHYQAILPQLKANYVRLKRQTSTTDIETYELYMLKTAINQHTPQQWLAFQDMGFRIPAEFNR